jgi:hypothetical protein
VISSPRLRLRPLSPILLMDALRNLLPPKVIVIAQAGATVRGMRFYHPTLLNVSDHYARFLAGKGEVTIATIVR